jgi:group I intron endonuclease
MVLLSLVFTFIGSFLFLALFDYLKNSTGTTSGSDNQKVDPKNLVTLSNGTKKDITTLTVEELVKLQEYQYVKAHFNDYITEISDSSNQYDRNSFYRLTRLDVLGYYHRIKQFKIRKENEYKQAFQEYLDSHEILMELVSNGPMILKAQNIWEKLSRKVLFEIISVCPDMKCSGIYVIHCISDHNIYIGSADNFIRRKIKHLSDLHGKQHPSFSMQDAFNRFGESNFKFYALEIIIQEQSIGNTQFPDVTRKVNEWAYGRWSNHALEQYVNEFKPKYNLEWNFREYVQLKEKERINAAQEKLKIQLLEKEKALQEEERLRCKKKWERISGKILFEITTDYRLQYQSGIYLILCCPDNRFYIGSTRDFYQRKAQHLSELRAGQHHSFILQEAFDRYGEFSFKFYVLEKIEKKKSVNSNALRDYNNDDWTHNNALKAIEQKYLIEYSPEFNVDSDSRGVRHWSENSKYHNYKAL